MPNHELTRALERIRQGRQDLRRELAGAGSLAAAGASQARPALTLGARVFDLISGEEGEIVGFNREHIIIPPTK